MLPVEIVAADLDLPLHQQAIVALIDAYARDPMGQGKPLAMDIRQRLISGLRQLATTRIFLAYQGTEAIGVAVCFVGFSTFAARPLLNIHDLAVLPAYRGLGVSQRLLEAVAQQARAMGCCKLTLEVQENNHRARQVYAAAGFAQARADGNAGGVFFLSKPL
jgi:GNAT superfamily N-acetyltransferase